MRRSVGSGALSAEPQMIRKADADIPPAEQLFRGIRPEWVAGATVLDVAFADGWPAPSFNREAHSTPGDVVGVIAGHTGAAALRVGDIPPQITRPEGDPYDCRAVDSPMEANPAHAEVRAWKSGTAFNGARLPRPVRKLAQLALSNIATVAVQPR